MTLIYRGENILRGFDDDVRHQMRLELEKQGVRVITGCHVAAVEKIRSHFSVRLLGGNAISADRVMFATGRRPNVAGFGLEAVGVKLAEHGGISVDKFGQTSVPHMYAIGDVTNGINLTPVAIRDGHAFADTVFGGKPTPIDHINVPTAVFRRGIGAMAAEMEARRRWPGESTRRCQANEGTCQPDTTILLKLGVTRKHSRLRCQLWGPRLE